MSGRAKSEEDRTKWPASGQPQRLAIPRTTVAYWRERVEKVTGRGGVESPTYSARIGFQGRRMRFPLHTPNKDAAAQQAAKIFNSLLKVGWEETLLKFKPYLDRSKDDQQCGTVGALIEAASKYSLARENSFRAYTQAFRKIVADIVGISGNQKHQTRKIKGNKKWREAVDAISLAQITPAKVQAWKQSRLKEAGRDASAKRSTLVTINATVRNAKALFSNKIIQFIREEVVLPDPLPFQGVKAEKVGSLKYQSKIDAQKLVKAAEAELREQYPEVYKFFVLALVCGLRVSEIDNLLWEAFDLERSILRIENTEFHELKSEDSAGEIDLSDKLVEFFEEQIENANNDFVIENDKEGSPSRVYRCQEQIDHLKTWLRANGVKAQKPIHTLRKEVGAMIASEQGIYAASRYLRHSNIQVTAAYYADKKRKVIPTITIDALGRL